MTHIVFDVYSPSSLKAGTRCKRSQGGTRKVTKNNTVPSHWCNFLRHSDNKMELFQFLAEMIAQMLTPNLVVVTNGPDVLSTHESGLNGLDNCYHEETDSRIFVHAKFATEHGSKAIMIKANDTDVVIVLSVFPILQRLGLEQLWVTFGQGHSLRWISAQDICHMGEEKRHIILSCLHRLWHSVSLPQQGQENDMADMGHLSRGLPCILQTESVPSHSGRWWPGDAGEVCHIGVW